MKTTNTHQSFDTKLNRISENIKKGVLVGSYQSSLPILKELHQLIKSGMYKSSEELLNQLKTIGAKLQHETQLEYATVNIVRRVMYMVREARTSVLKEDSEVQANELHKLTMQQTEQKQLNMKEFRTTLIELVEEFRNEIENIYGNISDEGNNYINEDDTILLYGKSRTVLEFLSGIKGKHINVIVINSLQRNDGEEIIKDLKSRNIHGYLVAESSMYSILPHVNKIIIGCHVVFSNGGLITTSGAYSLCALASQFHIPIYTCTGTYKICPNFPTNTNDYALIQSPLKIIPSILSNPSIINTTTGLEEVLENNQKNDNENDEIIENEKKEEKKENIKHKNQFKIEEPKYVRVINSTFDYIQPDWIHLFITDIGGISPNYIYRFIAQKYNPDDTFFFDEKK